MKDKNHYETPEVLLIEFVTEKGFAISSLQDGGEFHSNPSGTDGWD